MALVGTFIASECAAWLLDTYPTSYVAWQLNFGLFRAFENARAGMLPLKFLFAPASLPVAILLLLIIVVVRKLQSRFAVALFANLSFIGSIMLTYAVTRERLTDKAALLTIGGFTHAVDLQLVAALLISSFVAFAFSHLSFASAIRKGVSKPRVRVPSQTNPPYPSQSLSG